MVLSPSAVGTWSPVAVCGTHISLTFGPNTPLVKHKKRNVSLLSLSMVGTAHHVVGMHEYYTCGRYLSACRLYYARLFAVGICNNIRFARFEVGGISFYDRLLHAVFLRSVILCPLIAVGNESLRDTW